eukprot:4318377-Amphidinium_carterae.1
MAPQMTWPELHSHQSSAPEHDAIRLLVQSALDSAVLQTSEVCNERAIPQESATRLCSLQAESRHCRKRTKDVLQEALEDDGAHKALAR